MGALALQRYVDESVEIWLEDGRVITINVAKIMGNRVRLAFVADRSIKVFRKELADAARRQKGARP